MGAADSRSLPWARRQGTAQPRQQGTDGKLERVAIDPGQSSNRLTCCPSPLQKARGMEPAARELHQPEDQCSSCLSRAWEWRPCQKQVGSSGVAGQEVSLAQQSGAALCPEANPCRYQAVTGLVRIDAWGWEGTKDTMRAMGQGPGKEGRMDRKHCKFVPTCPLEVLRGSHPSPPGPQEATHLRTAKAPLVAFVSGPWPLLFLLPPFRPFAPLSFCPCIPS